MALASRTSPSFNCEARAALGRFQAIRALQFAPREAGRWQLRCCSLAIEVMNMTVLANLPGFRRRFRITPATGVVSAEVEDDFHCMSVTVRHRNGVTTAVEPVLFRAPWTTCPGAVERLKQTFS